MPKPEQNTALTTIAVHSLTTVLQLCSNTVLQHQGAKMRSAHLKLKHKRLQR